MVNSMLFYSSLSEGFWGEAILIANYVLNRAPNKRNKIAPYELWFKNTPTLRFFRIQSCRDVVKLTEPKRNNLGENGIDCIFIGYAKHSKAYKLYVMEPNEYVSVHTMMESRGVIFDEMRFSSMVRPKDLISSTSELPNSEKQNDVVEPKKQEIQRSKSGRIAKKIGFGFQVYLVEGSRDEIGSQYAFCYSIEDDPKTFKESMESPVVAFWTEAINDEISQII